MRTARPASVLLAAALPAACGAMNVVSDGDDSNLMLKGYDPVAYFTVGKPVRGRPDIKVEHRGVTYRFASDANRRMFITSPERYAPQYGGLCTAGLVYAIPAGGQRFGKKPGA